MTHFSPASKSATLVVSDWECSDRNHICPTLVNFLNAAESLDSLEFQLYGIMRILTHRLQRNSSGGRGPSAKTICKGDQVCLNIKYLMLSNCQRIERIHVDRATSLQKNMLHVMRHSGHRRRDDCTSPSQANAQFAKITRKCDSLSFFELTELHGRTRPQVFRSAILRGASL